MYYLRCVYIWIEKCTWLVISTIAVRKWRTSQLRSQPVRYTVYVVISRNQWCYYGPLMGTRKWYIAYRIEAIRSHLRNHSLLQALQMWFFVQLCSIWQDFDWRSASRCLSVIAELLVTKCASQRDFKQLQRPWRLLKVTDNWLQSTGHISSPVIVLHCNLAVSILYRFQDMSTYWQK